jgi:hypothetical protein
MKLALVAVRERDCLSATDAGAQPLSVMAKGSAEFQTNLFSIGHF